MQRDWYQMFRRLLTAISAALLTGCVFHTLPKDSVTLANLVELPVSGVIVSDGIDRSEAQILASAYFYGLYGNACGGIEFRTETPNSWIFSTAVGYAASPGPDIIVKKDGSVVYWRNGPDLYFRHGSWVYDKRGDPKANLEKAITEALKERAAHTSEQVPSQH